MLLKQKKDGQLVEVLGVKDLVNAIHKNVVGRLHHDEELQEPKNFSKADLVFPSGEALPRCWLDMHYRDQELRR